jgi:hypothetical protein
MLLRLLHAVYRPNCMGVSASRTPSLAELPVVGNTVRKPDGRLGIGSLWPTVHRSRAMEPRLNIQTATEALQKSLPMSPEDANGCPQPRPEPIDSRAPVNRPFYMQNSYQNCIIYKFLSVKNNDNSVVESGVSRVSKSDL